MDGPSDEEVIALALHWRELERPLLPDWFYALFLGVVVGGFVLGVLSLIAMLAVQIVQWA